MAPLQVSLCRTNELGKPNRSSRTSGDSICRRRALLGGVTPPIIYRMDFDLSDEQRAFQDTAREFARDEWLPYAPGWDEREEFPEEALRKAAALGFAGIYVGDRFGNEAQRARFLPKLMSMEHFASYCLTEPGSGSDAAALQTRARRDGEDYVLDGAKAFISGGGRSDLYVTMVRTGETGPRGISCLVVENGTKGLSFGKPEKKLGWHTQPTAMVNFENCRVPVANRLGAEGEGFSIAMMGLDGGRLNIGACSLGGARAAMEAARGYMLERRQFGQRLADFQALQFKLADMATELDAARLMLRRAASSLDTGDPEATLHCAMAKRLATDAGFHVCNEALQLHGGYGYLKDFGVERYLRDVRVHQILEGTNEIMRVIIARRLLGG